MMEVIQNLTLTLPQGPLSLASSGLASGSDVERFQLALLSGPSHLAPGAIEAAVSSATQSSLPPPQGVLQPASDATPSTGTNNLGDAILQTLQAASTHMQETWAHAAQIVQAPNLQMADVLQLQMSVIQTSIQYELLGKGIGKATQNLEQILKTQ